jgi:ABC-type polysaccharide/polyol phosphate export permease
LIPLVSQLSMGMGGLFFPAQMLPPPVYWLMKFLPVTSGLELLRVGLSGATPAEYGAFLVTLTVSSFSWFLAGFFWLHATLVWAKANGRLR